MTEESVNASSRKCVTLRLDPCPLELHFGAIFEISTGHRKKNNCIYEDISTRLIKNLGLGAPYRSTEQVKSKNTAEHF